MIPQTRKYFFIIVHYGQSGATDRLLAQLLAEKPGPDGILVIDHAEDLFVPGVHNDIVRVLRPESNNGYGGGVLLGLGGLVSEMVQPEDIIVCCNNDAVLPGDFFRNLRSYWQAHREAVLAGGKMGRVNLFTGRTSLVKGEARFSLTTMPYVHGSCFSAPFDVFMKAQFPDQFFMYWEDVLFSKRVVDTGATLAYERGLSVQHDDEVRDRLSSDKLYYLVRNGALFLQRETPAVWRMYWYICNRVRYTYHKALKHIIVAEALHDAIRGKSGKRVSV